MSPASLPCGMATPSPMPVEPSFSRSCSTSTRRSGSREGWPRDSDSHSSAKHVRLDLGREIGDDRFRAEELGDSAWPRAHLIRSLRRLQARPSRSRPNVGRASPARVPSPPSRDDAPQREPVRPWLPPRLRACVRGRAEGVPERGDRRGPGGRPAPGGLPAGRGAAGVAEAPPGPAPPRARPRSRAKGGAAALRAHAGAEGGADDDGGVRRPPRWTRARSNWSAAARWAGSACSSGTS